MAKSVGYSNTPRARGDEEPLLPDRRLDAAVAGLRDPQNLLQHQGGHEHFLSKLG